jgi:hypothetical protein
VSPRDEPSLRRALRTCVDHGAAADVGSHRRAGTYGDSRRRWFSLANTAQAPEAGRFPSQRVHARWSQRIASASVDEASTASVHVLSAAPPAADAKLSESVGLDGYCVLLLRGYMA